MNDSRQIDGKNIDCVDFKMGYVKIGDKNYQDKEFNSKHGK